MRSGRGGRRALALACTAALMLAGCGAAADEERDRSDSERARAALLRQADLPAAWTQTDIGGSADEIGDEELATLCPDYPAEWLKDDGAAATSFQSDSGVVAHGVTISASEDVEQQFDDFASDRSKRCLRNIVERGLGEDVGDQEIRFEVTDVETRELDLDDDQRGMRVELTLTATEEGVDLPVVGDFVVARAGAAFSLLTTMTIGAEPDEELRDRLAATAGERLQRNFG